MVRVGPVAVRISVAKPWYLPYFIKAFVIFHFVTLLPVIRWEIDFLASLVKVKVDEVH